MINFNVPAHTDETITNILEVFKEKHASGDGKFTKLCNKWIEDNFKCEKALLVHSGTAALELAAIMCNLEVGDEVIMPSYTFVSTANAFVLRGAKPVFVDIRPDTLNIDEKLIESAITPKTKAIAPVHYAGIGCEMDTITEIARKHNLLVVEDAAQAFGASQESNDSGLGPRRACTLGDISITSFYPSKPLGCYGDGGAIFTSDVELAEKVRMLANHGCRERYLHETVGMNSRLDALQAAILRVKLRHFEDELKVRRENARKYNDFFAAFGDIQPQRIAPGNTSTYAQYTLLVRDRETFIQVLDRAQVPHCIHYPMPLHRQPCFAGAGCIADGSKNHAEIASQKAVSLPVCAFTDVDFIINKLRSVL